jgi:hypothetical protein
MNSIILKEQNFVLYTYSVTLSGQDICLFFFLFCVIHYSSMHNTDVKS